MEKISFVINTAKNELEHVKLLLKSLKENLDRDDHEILVFVDSDNQGTLDYLKYIKPKYKNLKIITHKVGPCVGYSRNNNLLVDMAENRIVSYLQSDMVISPHYDSDVLNNIEENCILSSTRVEPPLHGESPITITKDFGVDPIHFDLLSWNLFAEQQKKPTSITYFFAPLTFYKEVWGKLGGYDTLFRRSREDSDLVQRCLHSGVKLKQTYGALVYHFTCTSSRGPNWFSAENKEAQERLRIQNIADKIELKRFVRRWGGFNHGTEKLIKYDIDLFIKNSSRMNPNTIFNIEPYFSRIWLDNKKVIKEAIGLCDTEHVPANFLLGFNGEAWDKCKHLYNQQDYKQIYKYAKKPKKDYSILIEADSDKLGPDDYNFLVHLHKIIQTTQPGKYEFGNFKFDIKELKETTKTRIKNPKFDKKLLEIH